MIPKLTDKDFERLSPLVRARIVEGTFGKKAHLLCLDDQTVFTGRCRIGKQNLLVDGSLDAIRSKVRRLREIRLDDVTAVDIRPGGLRTQMANVRIQGSKNRLKARIPQCELEHVVAFLQNRLKDKVTIHRRTVLHSWGLSFLILLIMLIAGFLIFASGGNPTSGIIIACFCLPLLIVQIHDHFPAKYPWEIKDVSKKSGRDRSGIKPFRSKFLGWGLKVVAAVMLLLIWILGFPWLLAVPFLLLIYLGHLLASVPPKLVHESDERAPILYLRSFFDDRKTTLMPYSRNAVFMGVQPPRYLPSPWRYILMFNPVRILRILFGYCVDTSEEQLALFFRKHGPVVAIGKPGERFATPGAARMYVTNEEWQGVVLEHLDTSQIVLLQPAQTEGVWWEVEKTLKHVAPQKILFCMVNFHGKQNDYEKFRLRAEEFLKQPLPARIGYTRTPAFIYFDTDWNSYLQEVSCRSPMIWPFVGDPVDLPYTLQPFLNSATGIEAIDKNSDRANQSPEDAEKLRAAPLPAAALPRPPRGVSSREQFSGALFYLILLLFLGMFSSMTDVARQAARQAAIDARDANLAAADRMAPAAKVANEVEQRDALNVGPDGAKITIAELTSAIELDGTDAESYFARGDAFQQQNRLEEAIADYRKSVAINPTHAIAWNNLGATLDATDQRKDAIESYTKAIDLVQDVPNYFNNRGLTYLETNEPDLAIADFQSSLNLNNQQAPIYFLCGKALAKKADWVAAIKHYNTGIELDSDMLGAWLARADAFYAIGDQKSAEFNPFDFARRDIDELLKRQPDQLQRLVDRATINEADGRLEDSVADLNLFLQANPKNVQVLAQRSVVHYKRGKFEESIADLDAILRLNPDNDQARMERSGPLLSLKRYDEIVSDMDLVLKSQPDKIDALLIRGNAFYFLGKFREALQMHSRVLELQPGNRTSLTMQAQMHAEQGMYEPAAADYGKLVTGNPNDLDSQLFHLIALFQQGSAKEFQTRRSTFIKSYENNPAPMVQLLLLRLQILASAEIPNQPWQQAEESEWKERLAAMQKLVDSTQRLPAFILGLGAMQIEAGLHGDAVSTLAGIQAPNADELTVAGAQIWSSIALAELGKDENARQALTKAKDWVKESCPLTIKEGQKIPACGNWWQRAEIHCWLERAKSKQPD